MDATDFQSLHRLLYKRPGTSHEVKKNIRDFSGFKFADKVSIFHSVFDVRNHGKQCTIKSIS